MNEEEGNQPQDNFIRWVITAFTAVTAIGVAGIWEMSRSVTRLEVKVEAFATLKDDIKSIYSQIGRHETILTVNTGRIDRVEREQAARTSRIERLEKNQQ